MSTFCKCDFCAIRYDCIGFFPDNDGACAGFYVSPSLKEQYSEYLSAKADDKCNV